MNPRRLRALIVKERKQLFRDPVNIIIGILLPIILLVVIGYGMSFDVKDIRLAIGVTEHSQLTADLTARFQGSQYFKVDIFRSSAEAVAAVREHRADAALLLPRNLSGRINSGELELLVAVNAANPTQAMLKENYIKEIVAGSLGENNMLRSSTVMVPRMYFNATGESLYFMIPGLIVIIVTILGTMLTCMLLAREYEHGNLESMFVTPMHSFEILIAKALNNFVLGLIGITITLLWVRYLFHMPLRGSAVILFLGCALYLLMALAIGLLISSLTKNQFMACQVTMVVAFLPSVMLSGFVFEIANLPEFVQYITALVPARYFVDFLQSIFLVGNHWSTLLPNLAAIAFFAVSAIALAVWKSPKSLE